MERIKIDIPKVTRNELRHWTRDRDADIFKEAFQVTKRFKTILSIETPYEAKALYYQLDFMVDQYDPTTAGQYAPADANVSKAAKRMRDELEQKAKKQGINVKELV